jgi:hypothetical protein
MYTGYRFIAEDTRETQTAVRVGSSVEVDDISRLPGDWAEGNVQILDVRRDGQKTWIVNVYDQS